MLLFAWTTIIAIYRSEQQTGPTENLGRQLAFQFSIPEIHGGFHCCFSFLHTHPAMYCYCIFLNFFFWISSELVFTFTKWTFQARSTILDANPEFWWRVESFFTMCKNGVHARKLNNMVWIHLKPQALNQLWARFTLQCENWTQRMTCTSLSSSFCFSRWTRFGIVIPSTWCSHVQYTMLFSSNGHFFILLF